MTNYMLYRMVCGRICPSMDQRLRLIVFGAAALIILAVVLWGIILMVRNSQSQEGIPSENTTDLSSRLPVVSSTPSTTNAATSPPPGMKSYTGQGFSLNYPEKWGLLTCANSQSFELDPVNGSDIKDVICDEALKPVTILLADRLSCPGEAVTLGRHQAVRSKVSSGSDTNYRWCVAVGGKALDITHRVSPTGSRATSKDDYSAAVEEMIKAISTPGSGGS